MHEQRLAERRAPAGLALQVDRRGHVHERQPTNSVKPPVSSWSARVRRRWRAHDRGGSTAPNMIVTFERRPTPWAVRWASSHSSVVILSGHRIARTSSSRISAAVPGSDPQAGVHEPAQVVGERLAQPAGPLGDLEGGEAVDVDVGRGRLHRPGDVDVVVAVEVGVDAALEAHLGGAEVRRPPGTRSAMSSSVSR